MSERANEKKGYEAILSTDIDISQSTRFTLRQQKTPSILAMNIFGLVQLQLTYKTKDQSDFILSKNQLETLSKRKIKDEEIKSALNELNTYPIYIEEIKMGATLISSWKKIEGTKDYLVEFSQKMQFLYLLEKDKKNLLVFEGKKPVPIDETNKKPTKPEKKKEVEHYTRYTINYRFDFKRKYSSRLYEILSNYQHHKYHRMGVVSLKKRLGIIDLETKTDMYPRWADFNRKVLAPSAEEVKEVTTLKFNYSGYKTEGRAITGVMFTFLEAQKNSEPELALFDDEEKHLLEMKFLQNQYKLRKDQAQRFLQRYDLGKEKKELYKYYCLSKDPNYQYITNLGAYIAKVYDL